MPRKIANSKRPEVGGDLMTASCHYVKASPMTDIARLISPRLISPKTISRRTGLHRAPSSTRLHTRRPSPL